jgi:hypothetical protein
MKSCIFWNKPTTPCSPRSRRRTLGINVYLQSMCKLGPCGDTVGNITSVVSWFQLYMEAWTMRSIYTVIRSPFWLWESSRTGRIWILWWRNFGPAIWVSPTSRQSWTHSEYPVRDTPFLGSRRTVWVRRRNDPEKGILKRMSSSWIFHCQILKALSRSVCQDTARLLHVSASHLQIYEIHFRLLDVPPSHPNNTPLAHLRTQFQNLFRVLEVLVSHHNLYRNVLS